MSARLSLLAPGIALMRRLRIPTKLALMGLFLLAPLLMLLAATWHSGRVEQQVALGELEGAQVAQALLAVVDHTQRHRGLTNRALSADAAASDALPAARQALTESLALVQARLADANRLPATPEWAPLQERLAALAAGRHAPKRQEAFAEHTATIEATRQVLLLVAERSGLLLDPVADTFFLMDIAIERLVPLSETLGVMRGQGAGLLLRQTNAVERALMLGRADLLQQQMQDLDAKVQALRRTGAPPPATWAAAREQAEGFARHARETFGAETVYGDAADFFARGSQALTALQAFAKEDLTQLQDALQARASDAARRTAWQLALATAGVLAMVYCALCFYFSFVGAFRALGKGVQAVADGNLEVRVDILGRDELAEIGALLEAMNGRLSAMVAEIRSSAVRVGQAGQQVADSSASLSQRTDEQAASLRQTVATVSQLSAAVAANADAAQQLDHLAERLRAQAEAGGQQMQATVGAMDSLQSSSKRVGEIIGVIDGIAFQTNILALNAAVEAARAGEAGRGFAVVASEVRSLAQRSSAAAAEIRQLIGASTEQVGASVGRIESVNATLAAVVDGVKDVSGRLRGIASASAEQSQGLREMSQNVGNLDEITRQNAAMVEESSAASQELVQRADSLSSAVASIRLRQGSADEARDLVERAMGVFKSQGWDGACRTMHDRANGFVDRDLYIFVVDRDGRYLLHAAKPASEGKRVHDLPGIDGDRFVRDAFERSERGPGWIEYDILNLETGQVQPKASYVRRLDDGRVVGCGVYRLVTAKA